MLFRFWNVLIFDVFFSSLQGTGPAAQNSNFNNNQFGTPNKFNPNGGNNNMQFNSGNRGTPQGGLNQQQQQGGGIHDLVRFFYLFWSLFWCYFANFLVFFFVFLGI